MRSSQVFALPLLSLLLVPSAALGQATEAPAKREAPAQPEAPAKPEATPPKSPASKKTESVPAPAPQPSAATAEPVSDKPVSPAPANEATPSAADKTAPAGPSDKAQAAAEAQPAQLQTAPPEPSNAVAYPIRVESPITGLQLQLHRIQLGDIEHSPTQDYDAFVDACASPCQASIEPGAYQLAVRTPTGERARASTGLLLQGPATVTADVVSNAETRREGWYWIAIGSAVGAIAASVGLAQNCDDNTCAKQAAMGIWGGITTMSVSWLIGFPKVRTEDEVNITISPGVTSAGQDAALHQRRGRAF